jgi:hypothetical protein
VSGKLKGAMQSHKPGQHAIFRIILEMFHVKHFCPVAAQNLTRTKTALLIDFVRSIDFLVQSESGGGGASMIEYVAGSQFRCKIHSCRGRRWSRPPPAFDDTPAVTAVYFCTGIIHQKNLAISPA